MRKSLNLAAGALAVIAASTASLHGQSVTSIQFTSNNPYEQGGPTVLLPTDVAGEDAVDNWNVVAPLASNAIIYGPTINGQTGPAPNSVNVSGGSLVTAAGGASPVTYSITGGGPSNFAYDGLTGANYKLLGNGDGTFGPGNTSGTNNATLYGGPVTLALSGLSAGDTYSFIAYVNAGFATGEGSVSASSGGTQYFMSENGGFAMSTLTTFVDDASTTDFSGTVGQYGLGAYQANYVEFTDVTDITSETLTLNTLGTFPNGGGTFVSPDGNGSELFELTGVQMLDTTAAVPEPSTFGLMAAGLIGLAAYFRRSRVGVTS